MLADVNNLVAVVKCPQPDRELTVAQSGRVELGLTHPDHRDPDDVPPLEHRVGRDVDALDGERPVEPDPPERAVRLLAEVAAGALVQRDRERRRAVRP